MEAQNHLVHPLMRSFMYGQFANLFKMALWWTALAPLTYALLNGSTEAIGVGRIVYNTALCVVSPIGGLIVERIHPKTILRTAAASRFLIWSVMIPLTWFLFQSSIVTTSEAAVYVILNICLFFDGMTVGLSTILDIDLAGVDIIAGTYGLDVTDEHRNQFNSRQEFFFACCFVVFSPGMAFLGLAIHEAFSKASSTIPAMALESGTLTAIFFGTFLVATALNFFFFSKLPSPGEQAGGAAAADGAKETSPLEGQGIAAPPADGPPAAEGPPPTFCDQVKSVPSDLKASIEVIWHNPPVLWRLVFLGFEIAFEDAAIVVIASQMGITLPWLGNGDSVHGNIWTAVAVAVGKLGGAIASVLMMKFYTPPTEPKKFIPIFALITISCLFVFMFPATVDLYDEGKISANVARFLFLLAFFMYFFVSTLPKLGLMCLFQSMVSQIENGPRVFGFVAIVATSFDATVIMALSVIFVKYEMLTSLWITAGIYMAHGVLEMIVGPLLVVAPLKKIMDDNASHQATASTSGGGEDGRSISTLHDAPPLAKETTSLIGNVQGGSSGGHSQPIAVGGSADDDSRRDLGTFTQRSAAVPIGSYMGGSLRAPHDISGSVRTAVLSTSMHGAGFATVQRKRSTLEADGGYGAMGGAQATQYTRHGSALTPRPTSPRTVSRSPGYN